MRKRRSRFDGIVVSIPPDQPFIQAIGQAHVVQPTHPLWIEREHIAAAGKYQVSFFRSAINCHYRDKNGEDECNRKQQSRHGDSDDGQEEMLAMIVSESPLFHAVRRSPWSLPVWCCIRTAMISSVPP